MDTILVVLIVIGALVYCVNRFRRMGRGSCACEKGSCTACSQSKDGGCGSKQ